MNEAERIERLRAQDGKPLVPPVALQPLISGGSLDPAKIDQALAQWQQARAELDAGGGFAAAERLYFLMMLLYTPLAQRNEEKRVRALLETTLELLVDPRHQAVVRGMLARNAARVGDFDAAEQWLLPCEARSDDIHIDTAYRYSRAYLAARRQQYDEVLQQLGSRVDDVPIADTLDLTAGALRADALEKMGRFSEAKEQLAAVMQTVPDGVAGMERVIAVNHVLGLCPQSFPAAREQVRAGGLSGPGMHALPGGFQVQGRGAAGSAVRHVQSLGVPTASGDVGTAAAGALGCVFMPLGAVFLAVGLTTGYFWLRMGWPPVGIFQAGPLPVLAPLFSFLGLVFLGVAFAGFSARKKKKKAAAERRGPSVGASEM
jgi:hypothetical protein